MKHYKDTNNTVFAYESDGSQDYLIGNKTPITDEEANELRASNLDYKQKRLREYPTIGDQLDALYHAGIFPEEMANKILEIKTKYPKV